MLSYKDKESKGPSPQRRTVFDPKQFANVLGAQIDIGHVSDFV